MGATGFDDGAKGDGNALGNGYLQVRGLRERERKRLNIQRPHSEPPMTEHNAILSQSVMPFGRAVRNSFKLLLGSKSGTLPPKMIYRLSSLGESFSERQKSDPVMLAKRNRAGEFLIIAPKEKRTELKQVLLVDKATRVELESGQQRSEAAWGFRMKRWQIPLNARVVLIYTDGANWQLPLRSLKPLGKLKDS